MGQDYRLIKLYEQLYKQQDSQTEELKKTKSLQEAYKTVLTERTAFYAKDIGAEEEIPNIQGLENLGAVEQPQKIKHTIASLSVLPALEKAVSKEVSGWGAIKGVDLDRVAKDFIVSGVSGSDLEKITNHKSELTAFQEAVEKSEIFNLVEVIVSDLKTKAGVEADSESLALIFKRLFDEEGTISGTAVGKGEFAISLFTNCVKGKTGDLLLPSGKTIEVKGIGGRLGPAEYSQANTGKDLVQFLAKREQKNQSGLNRALVLEKIKFKKFAVELETQPQYKALFTDKFKETLHSIADNFGNPKLVTLIEKAGLSTRFSIKNEDVVWKLFTKLGYIQQKSKEIEAAPMEKAYVVKVQDTVRRFLLDSKDGILRKGRLEKIASKTVSIEALQSQTFTTAVQDFFLNDLGLTPDEAAEAFLSTKSYNKDVTAYLPEIRLFFRQYYSKMIEGDSRYLQAAVFAFQLALYAHAGEEGQHFDYFMIMNNATMNALSLDVARKNLFTYLSSVFLNNIDSIKLSIRADGRQGASAVSLK